MAVGALGGRLGARVPDWLEPATSPNHRGVMHSAAVGTGLGVVLHRACSSWEQWARSKADEFEAKRQASDDPLMNFVYLVAEYALRIGVGVPAGMVAGYLSHLALDMTTPKSIPLLAPGF